MVKIPSKPTLKKYGLSVEEWQAILDRQGGVCAVCKKEPPSGRLVTDHEHVKNWKKMPPEQRKLYVRGLLCWTDNHYTLGRAVTIAKLENGAQYLRDYAARRPQ